MQFLLFLVKARETGRHLQAALVDVLLAVDLFRCLVQQLQHSTDDGLQRTSQVFPAIRLSKGRHVNKGGAAVAQVQGCVVGKITEIPMKAQHSLPLQHTQTPSSLLPLLFPRLLLTSLHLWRPTQPLPARRWSLSCRPTPCQ